MVKRRRCLYLCLIIPIIFRTPLCVAAGYPISTSHARVSYSKYINIFSILQTIKHFTQKKGAPD